MKSRGIFVCGSAGQGFAQSALRMTSYEEILESAKRLSSTERLLLADALLAEQLGFGMWREREDVADAEDYVSDLRDAEMRIPEGREKTPEEFLREINS